MSSAARRLIDDHDVFQDYERASNLDAILRVTAPGVAHRTMTLSLPFDDPSAVQETLIAAVPGLLSFLAPGTSVSVGVQLIIGDIEVRRGAAAGPGRRVWPLNPGEATLSIRHAIMAACRLARSHGWIRPVDPSLDR